MNVLIVDDKEENRYFLATLLGSGGDTVTTVRNGAEALAQARAAAPPDLVVADLLMPVMDGYTLLRAWKSDPVLARVPFIVYTATYTDPEDERLAVQLGADAFLIKPLEPEELLGHIRRVLAVAPAPLIPDAELALETSMLREYSEALVRKLERRTEQLELTNRALQAEIAERRQQSELQASILDALPAHVALLDASGTILTVNAAWRRFVAENAPFTAPFVVGANYVELCEQSPLHPEHGDGLRRIGAEIRRLLAGEASEVNIQYAWPSAEEQRWYRLMIMPLGAHQRARAVVMNLDVTERAQAEQSLRESEERFRQIAENISEVFWIIDPVGHRVLYVSPAYEQVWGRSCESLYQDPASWLDVLDAEDRDRVLASWELRQSQGQVDVTYRVFHPDGSIRWIRDRSFPVRDASGVVFRVVGIAEDVTANREADARQQRLQSQVLEERFKLEKLSLVAAMAAGVAHELNQPLTIMSMAAENASDALDNGDLQAVRTRHERIIEQAERARAIINQLRSFSRTDGDQGPLVPVDLRTEVGGVLLLVGPQLRTAGITVEVVPAEPPLVLGRHVAVQQVLVNLLLNARDALKDLPPARPRRIRIELMDDSEAAMVRLAISDTGGGVAPDNIGRVFEPFFTTKPPGEGTGLGLALCLLFMQSFSGDIAVRNDPQGAVFTLGFRTAPPAAV